MNLFIRDIPISLYPLSKKLIKKRYDDIIDVDNQKIIAIKPNLQTWIKNATDKTIGGLLDSIYAGKIPPDVPTISVSVKNYHAVKKYIKKQFDIVLCAAGGVVNKQNRILLINRLNKWDLPKGKKELKETYAQTAVREIKEECNVHIATEKKICVTWHSYEQDGNSVLKQTHWYAATLIDDTHMKPCLEEHIEAIKWMHQKEAQQAINNSYCSIRFVLKKYYNYQQARAQKAPIIGYKE